ncbi:MAG: diadenosine tetraphosphate (Ap4A) HIT family hydrolase [Alphaproteobacteria bacterium]|jgi:diadenosine tetraphosphate (Ap4A) HIT family hydrolase
MEFSLHRDFLSTCIEVCRFSLCRVLLNDDSNFPWVILVPERLEMREIHDLAPADRALLIEEIASVSSAMSTAFNAYKINVGALGNATPQLHVHVIVRYKNDLAGLGPVWNAAPPAPYAKNDQLEMVKRLQGVLSSDGVLNCTDAGSG